MFIYELYPFKILNFMYNADRVLYEKRIYIYTWHTICMLCECEITNFSSVFLTYFVRQCWRMQNQTHTHNKKKHTIYSRVNSTNIFDYNILILNSHHQRICLESYVNISNSKIKRGLTHSHITHNMYLYQHIILPKPYILSYLKRRHIAI